MATLVDYKGLSVLNIAVNPGSNAISDDLSTLADRIGPCNYTATTDPTSSDNTSSGYYVGSRWMNQAEGTEWVCIASNSTAATWQTTTLDASDFDPAGSASAAQAAAEANAASLYLPLTGGTISGTITVTQINYPDGSVMMNQPGPTLVYYPGTSNYVFGSAGYLFYGSGATLADAEGNLYYNDGSHIAGTLVGPGEPVLFYPAVNSILATELYLCYPGAGLGSPLADDNGTLYVGNQSTAPPSPVPGMMYFDTSTNQFKGYNGSTWVVLG